MMSQPNRLVFFIGRMQNIGLMHGLLVEIWAKLSGGLFRRVQLILDRSVWAGWWWLQFLLNQLQNNKMTSSWWSFHSLYDSYPHYHVIANSCWRWVSRWQSLKAAEISSVPAEKIILPLGRFCLHCLRRIVHHQLLSLFARHIIYFFVLGFKP